MTLTAEKSVQLIGSGELPAAIAALEQWLDMPGQLVGTYPQVFGADRDAALFGVFGDGQLVAHAAVHTVRVRAGTQRLRIGLIGSVATHPNHRGAGIASDLLRHIMSVASAAQCDALMLWSDLWSFYERLGFGEAGGQLEVELAADANASDDGIRLARDTDVLAITALHHQKPRHVERDVNRMRTLLATCPMDVVVFERDSQVLAYGCHRKGADFDGWWHEVGGDDEHVATLVRGAMRLLGQPTATLMLPSYRTQLLPMLQPAVTEVRSGISGLSLPLTQSGAGPLFVDGLDSI